MFTDERNSSFSKAECRMVFSSFAFNESSIKILALERRAGITSNEGFSVVAPIKIIVPDSTEFRSTSC